MTAARSRTRRLLKFFEFTLVRVQASGEVVEQKAASVLFQVFTETCRAAPGKRHWETLASRDGIMVSADEAKKAADDEAASSSSSSSSKSSASSLSALAKLEALYNGGLLSLQVFREAKLLADRQSAFAQDGGGIDPLLQLMVSTYTFSDPAVSKILRAAGRTQSTQQHPTAPTKAAASLSGSI